MAKQLNTFNFSKTLSIDKKMRIILLSTFLICIFVTPQSVIATEQNVNIQETIVEENKDDIKITSDYEPGTEL